MSLKDLAAVSGLPGLFRVVNSRSNGIIMEEIETGKSRFISIRKHQITPLESVAVYTEDGSTDLKDIFATMRTMNAETAVPELSSNKESLISYFEEVLPNYDREAVKISDIKKIVKWYKFLDANNLLSTEEDDSDDDPDDKSRDYKDIIT